MLYERAVSIQTLSTKTGLTIPQLRHLDRKGVLEFKYKFGHRTVRYPLRESMKWIRAWKKSRTIKQGGA